ncbi:GroES-like protein [Pilatotrama ljubarskyi]|nr:GroES-like protein [Pilatotrama ljubarskyi]
MDPKSTPTIPHCIRASKYIPCDIHVTLLHHAPVPEPKKDEVLLKVAAAGVCHTDITILFNAFIDDRSYTLGHETAAWAVKLGEGVDPEKVEIAKLYALYALRSRQRPEIYGLGLGIEGGLAEYIVAKWDQLSPVPEGLDPEVAAVAADSLLTVYNAVYNIAELPSQTKQRVLVYGVGGLGHMAAQLAKRYGAKVYACDYTGGPPRGTLQSNAARPHSQIGYSADHLPMNAADLIINRTHMFSVMFGTPDDLRASLDLLKIMSIPY